MANPPVMPGNGAEDTPLTHDHIAQALLASSDGGQTLDFSDKRITKIHDESATELAQLGREDDEDEGCVTRIALVFNSLQTLPTSFSLITRLRYLNLRSNTFNVFPEVLCNMPSLEILDISRNKLKRLPARPGTLRNLRVFSCTKNKIERLPAWFSELNRLRMLKIEHNPFEWPPTAVLKRTQDGDEAMEAWIRELQAWLRANAGDEEEAMPPSETGIEQKPESRDVTMMSEEDLNRSMVKSVNGTSSTVHSRAPSDESLTSGPRPLQPALPPPDFSLTDTSPSTSVGAGPSSFSAGSHGLNGLPTSVEDFMNSHRDDSVLGTVHGRNASTSFMNGRSQSASAGLYSKKSLPDLRSTHYNPSFPRQQRKGSELRRDPNEPAVPTIDPLHQSTRDLPSSSRPSTRPSAVIPPASGATSPMELERQSYFKRYSTLQSSYVSKSIPEPMLKTVDAIRGIFFALGQMHSAIQHYTVFGKVSNANKSSTALGRLMTGAEEYMMRHMSALDRFDSLSPRGLPPPPVCRELIEACRDNVAISIKVVGVLNAQLKVLAATDDLRFARTSLLMLYGSMAEISNSWHALAPHLESIQPLLEDYRPPPASRSHGASTSTPQRSNITPIAESPSPSPRPVRSPHLSNGNITAKPSRAIPRRNAGSFSYKDLQLGRNLAASTSSNTEPVSQGNTPPSSSTPTPISSTSAQLKSALKNPIASGQSTNLPSPALSHSSNHSSSNITHSREGSMNLNYSTSARATPLVGAIPRPQPATPSLARSRTSDLPGSAQIVDRDLLSTMDGACDTALAACTIIEEELLAEDTSLTSLKDVAGKVRTICGTLKRDVELVRTGYLESEKKALWDNANTFAKLITQLAMMLKPHTPRMSPNLRSHIEKLINATKDYTILLSVSSFAPPASLRPFSPAVATSGVDHHRPGGGAGGAGGIPGLSVALGRSRSATATQDLVPKPAAPHQKDVPWSAMPHQQFKVPNLPPSSLAMQRFDEEEERPQRRI